MRALAIAALVAAAGCGGDGLDPNGPSPVASGSRLRARWEVAGSARRLVGWHDAQLGIDCGFEQYVYKHEHRCVPSLLAAVNGSFFGDASCSQPLASTDTGTPDGCTPPQYVVQWPEDSCATEPTFFQAGPAVDPASVYQLSNGACTPTPNLGFTLYRIGAPVAASTFASAAEQPDQAGQMWLISDDGARVPWGGFDGTRAVQPTHTDDGKARWAPWLVAYVLNAFADPSCTTPAATKGASGARCPLDAVLAFAPTPKCGGTIVSFSEIGAPLDTTYSSQNGACTANPPNPGELAFRIGAPIPDGVFAEVGSALVGEAPVQLRYATLAGRAIRQTAIDAQFGGNGPPRPDTFVDTSTGEDCAPSIATDGKIRCMPSAVEMQSMLYADAGCTQPVYVSYFSNIGQCVPPSVPPVFAWSDYGAICAPAPVHVRPILEMLTQPSLWWKATPSDPCAPYNAPTGPVYRLGDELPPTAFAEVTTATD